MQRKTIGADDFRDAFKDDMYAREIYGEDYDREYEGESDYTFGVTRAIDGYETIDREQHGAMEGSDMNNCDPLLLVPDEWEEEEGEN